MLLFTVVCVVYLNGIKWQFHLRDVKKVRSKETVGNTCIVLKVIFVVTDIITVWHVGVD